MLLTIISGFPFKFLIAADSIREMLGRQLGKRNSGPVFRLEMGSILLLTREAVYSEISVITSCAFVDMPCAGGSQADLGINIFLNSLGSYSCVSSFKKSCSFILRIFLFLPLEYMVIWYVASVMDNLNVATARPSWFVTSWLGAGGGRMFSTTLLMA